MASSRKYWLAYLIHTFGDATRVFSTFAGWETLTDLADLTSVTTVDADSSGDTLYVADTAVFEDCEFGRSTLYVAGQILTVNGVDPGVSLTVSTISGTISSGQNVACGFHLEVYDDDSPYNDRISMSGAGSAVTSYGRSIGPAAGHGHGGVPGAGVLVDFSGLQLGHYEGVFELLEGQARVHDLEANLSGQNSAYSPGIFTLQAQLTRLVGCISCGSTNAGAGNLVGCKAAPASAGLAVNCLFADMDYGVVIVGAGFTFYCYNVTVEGCSGIGFWEATSATGLAKNCISENNTGGNWSGTWTSFSSYHNTNGDGVVFEDAGAYDYHPDETDTKARNLGLNLSADAFFAYDDDLARRTRNPAAWDIGSLEAVLTLVVSDGLVFGDGPGSAMAMEMAATDGLVFGDLPSVGLALSMSAMDGLMFGDAPGMSMQALLEASDGLIFSEVATAGLVLQLSASDGLVFGDTPVHLAQGLVMVTIRFKSTTAGASLKSTTAETVFKSTTAGITLHPEK
ncbi:MAG: hypothetical protein ABIJ95_08125 [Pseudomonadota bacterium]